MADIKLSKIGKHFETALKRIDSLEDSFGMFCDKFCKYKPKCSYTRLDGETGLNGIRNCPVSLFVDYLGVGGA